MEGLDRTAQGNVFSAYDREVLGYAFRSLERRHSGDPAKGPTEDISRLFNYSAIPALVIKASNTVMQNIPAISFEEAEANPVAQQKLFLQKTAENFAFYRDSLLEQDPNRPSGMKIKPEVYRFLSSVNTDFDNKILTKGLNLLWRKFAHAKEDPLAVTYDENLARYNLDIENLFASIRQRPNGTPASYEEFAAALQQRLASDPELLGKIRYLGEEYFADDLIWSFSLTEGMYEGPAASLSGNPQAKYNATALQQAKQLIRASQPLASKNFTTDPAEILQLERLASNKLIEATRAYNARQKQAGSSSYTGEMSLLDSYAGKMEPAAFMLMDRSRDYPGKQALETIYTRAAAMPDNDNKAILLDHLVRIKEWINSHQEPAKTPGFQSKLQALSEINDSAQLTHAVKNFLGEQQLPYFIQAIGNPSVAEEMGGALTEGKFILRQPTSTEAWTSLTNRGIYFEINGQQIIAGEQNQAAIFAGRPDITEQEKAALKLLDQRFFQSEEILINATRVGEKYNIFSKSQPDSIRMYVEEGRIRVSSTNSIIGFQYMSPTGLLEVPFDAQCQNTYQYDAERNCFELIGSSISGHDAEKAEALLYHPTDSKEYQTAISNINSAFKKAYQHQLSEAEKDQEAIYHLEQRLGEFEFSDKGPKNLFITNFTKELRGLYRNFYNQDKSAENLKNHLAALKAIQEYLIKNQAQLGEYLAPALKLIGAFELNMGSSNTAAARIVRNSVADSLTADIKTMGRVEARKLLADYQTRLETDPTFRKVMLEPGKPSRYIANIKQGDKNTEVSATGSHARIIKAAKEVIRAESKKPGAAPLSGSEKALLDVERKKPWASWKFWGTAVAALAGGALAGVIVSIAAPVIVSVTLAAAVIGGIALVAGAALAYFGLKTPKKAAEVAFKAPKVAPALVSEARAVEPAPAPSPTAAIEEAQPVQQASAAVQTAQGPSTDAAGTGLKRTASELGLRTAFRSAHDEPQRREPGAEAGPTP